MSEIPEKVESGATALVAHFPDSERLDCRCGWSRPDEDDYVPFDVAWAEHVTAPERRCEACVAEAFAITSARDPHTCGGAS